MTHIFYMNGFNVAPDEIVFIEVTNPTYQRKPGGSVFNADGFVLSPDGSKLVYYTEVSSSQRLRRCRVRIDGEFGTFEHQFLTGPPSGDKDRQPAFAPDNHRIAFARDSQIHLIHFDGTSLINLSQNQYLDRHPTWSPLPPDDRIAFTSNRSGEGWDIYLASPNTFSQAQQLTQQSYYSVSELVWSPDGRQIAFIAQAEEQDYQNLHVVDINSGSIQNITATNHQERSPSWSPSGGTIAFVRLVNGRWEIYTISANGGNAVSLVRPAGSNIRNLNWRLSSTPSHDGSCHCPVCVVGDDQVETADPISLRLGEKREQSIDLTLHSPGGALDFTRTYRQSKQDEYQTMGLGWLHNHEVSVENISSTKLIVILPNGGRTYFTQVGTTNQFNGDPGSNSVITVDSDSTIARYVLTISDQSIYKFDDQGRVRTRQWPNGEEWIYSYYEAGFASGKLEEVSDSYNRKLRFLYIDNSGQYNHLCLWRVGDHETIGLSDPSPDGRYIEYTYIDEKLDGVSVNDAQALLHQVRDVRGHIWTYRYYGQETGETDSDQANFLTAVTSPLADTDGDNTADNAIIIKQLSYSVSSGQINSVLQERGFLAGEDPSAAQLRTQHTFLYGSQTEEEVVGTGLIKTYNFTGGMLASSKDPMGNGGTQILASNFRPVGQVDAM